MALIKCTECGHEVSDKASACPNCGCPIESFSTTQVEVMDEEPKKKKGWIWALAVALLCLIGGGGYYGYAHFANSNEENGADSISGNDKDAIVELTPEFIKAIEVYDELQPFNEGYAAVRRGKKWGYINIKGEEVIACSFDDADFFSEGFAAVYKDERWGFIDTNGNIVIPMEYEEKPTPFGEGLAGIRKKYKFGWINTKGQEVIQPSTDAVAAGQFSEGLVFVLKDNYEDFMFLDKKGKTMFKGKCNGDIYYSPMVSALCEEFPRFHNGLVYVANPDEYLKPQKYTQYDKYGNKLKVISKQPSGFVLFAQGYNGKEADVGEVLINVDESSTIGLKDVDGNIIIPAQYGWVYTHFSNGVFSVFLKDEDFSYWGYADLKGNDTFTDSVKRKCEFWRRQNAEEKQKEQDEEEERLRQEGPDWLQGAWKLKMIDDDGNCLGYMYEVFNHGISKSYIRGSLVSERNYTISGNMVVYEKGHYQLDNDREVLIGANGQEFTKISHDVNYTPNYSNSSKSSSGSYSNGETSSSRSYRFSTAHDVIGYLADKSFYNGDICLRIRPEGVWFNNLCATGAPYVQRFESYKALVRAVSTMGPTYGYIIDPINNTVTDDIGNVFRLR